MKEIEARSQMHYPFYPTERWILKLEAEVDEWKRGVNDAIKEYKGMKYWKEDGRQGLSEIGVEQQQKVMN